MPSRSSSFVFPFAFAAVGLASATARAADVVPAPEQQAARHAEEARATTVQTATTGAQAPEMDAEYPVHPWRLPPVIVRGRRGPALREEELVGDYAQPRWTTMRRFPATRTYVVPKGKLEFEWWLRDDVSLAKGGAKLQSQWEVEMGLGHRLQLDLYLVTEQNGANGGPMALSKEKVELRYALADWGELWGNPTLYLEYARENDGPDALEGKLLFAGELSGGLHAGLNLVWERALGGEKTNEYAITGGLSYTVVDSVLHVGGEMKIAVVDASGARFDFVEQEYLVGPSFMLSPVPPMHILFAPLFGVAREGGETEGFMEAFLIAGWTL